jgi:16S rRNA (guanine527-N7)-methyltransferase
MRQIDLDNETLSQLVHLDVSRETTPDLEQIVALTLKWQAKTNLIAPSTVSDIWSRHVLDSVQLKRFLPAESAVIYDLGSGGGFPVLPMACLAKHGQPHSWTAIESNHKKTSYLRNASAALGLRDVLSVCSERIERAAATLPAPDIVTGRALAALGDLLGLSAPWTAQNNEIKFLLHKGREYRAEVDACAANWSFDLVAHQSVVDAESYILELTHVKHIG